MRVHDANLSADVSADAVAGIPGGPGLPPNAQLAPAARERQDCTAARRPGRPRSEQAEHAILEAAIEAVADRGIDGVSCEDVAARAGVGKATLYRRWPGKEDLLIAAFAALKRPLPEPTGESVRADLIAMLEVMAEDAEDPRFAQQFALLHAEGERYPRLVALYKERVVEPRRELMRSVLRRGIATGEIRPDADVEIALLALTGAVMIAGKHDALPAEPCFATRVVDELLTGLAPRLGAPLAVSSPARHRLFIWTGPRHPGWVMCALAWRGDAGCRHAGGDPARVGELDGANGAVGHGQRGAGSA